MFSSLKPPTDDYRWLARSAFTPPLDEQKRIVAKVDELTALCDRLEAQLQERDTRQAALARAALARFAAAPTTADHLLPALVAELTANP